MYRVRSESELTNRKPRIHIVEYIGITSNPLQLRKYISTNNKRRLTCTRVQNATRHGHELKTHMRSCTNALMPQRGKRIHAVSKSLEKFDCQQKHMHGSSWMLKTMIVFAYSPAAVARYKREHHHPSLQIDPFPSQLHRYGWASS